MQVPSKKQFDNLAKQVEGYSKTLNGLWRTVNQHDHPEDTTPWFLWLMFIAMSIATIGHSIALDERLHALETAAETTEETAK